MATYSGEKRTPIPVVDLSSPREEVIKQLKRAAGTMGVFQIKNHGVPESLMQEILNKAREFHELPEEEKTVYPRDAPNRIRYMNNVVLHKSDDDEWRNGLFCHMTPEPLDPCLLPQVCRNTMVEYSTYMKRLGSTIFELLSIALGLKPDHLESMDCMKDYLMLLNHYPPCPKPEPTLGIPKHSDRGILTILHQDQACGLQVRHQNQWLDVDPVPGAFTILIGDLLQLISNEAFRSVEHRAWANSVQTRVSVPCFFLGDLASSRLYKPIEELLSEDNPPLYHETTFRDFAKVSKPADGSSALVYLRL